MGGGEGGGEEGGRGVYIRIRQQAYLTWQTDFTHFWNTKIDGLFLTSAASFQILGKVNIGNLFTTPDDGLERTSYLHCVNPS
jgi:hypothetical protein